MALEYNKADVALLLSNYLVDHSQMGQAVVVAGGFTEAKTVKSSDPTLDLPTLEADHAEADTCISMYNFALYPCSYGINSCVSA